jgi:hypothetical protein
VAGGIVATVLVCGAFAHAATDQFVAEYGGGLVTKKWGLVTDDLRMLGTGAPFEGIPAVNVMVPSFWESAWAAYFLAPRDTFLASPEGVVAVPPRARWTLERADAPFLHPPSSDVRVVNATYRLVRERPDRVQQGAEWIVGACEGRYRFDGKRWRRLEPTPATGAYELEATPAARPVASRVPLLVRRARTAVDALLLEYLPGAQARIVAEHRGKAGRVPDPRLRMPPELVGGRSFAMTPGATFQLSVVFDPITGDQRVERNGEVLFAGRRPFLVAPQFAKAEIGTNRKRAAGADARFAGRLEVVPQPQPSCAG